MIINAKHQELDKNEINERMFFKIELNPELLMYINRISDMFHVLSRLANNEANQKEQQPIYKYFDKK